jgi:hypothetical protein
LPPGIFRAMTSQSGCAFTQFDICTLQASASSTGGEYIFLIGHLSSAFRRSPASEPPVVARTSFAEWMRFPFSAGKTIQLAALDVPRQRYHYVEAFPSSAPLCYPSSVLRPPTSVRRPLTAVFRPPTSVFRPLSSDLRPPTSVFRPPSSALAQSARCLLPEIAPLFFPNSA